MSKIIWLPALTVIAFCTAAAPVKADYSFRCHPLPSPIIIGNDEPLPDGLSPLARRHAEAARSYSEHTEVVQFSATPNILLLKYTIAKQPMSLIIVDIDGREHNFHMRQMRPVVISGYGFANEHSHEDIAFVGEYSLRVVKSYRGEQVLGTSIEVSPDYFRGRCDVPH